MSAANGGTTLNSLTSWSVGCWAYALVLNGSGTVYTGLLGSFYTGSSDIPIFLGVSYNSSGLTPASRWFVGSFTVGSTDWDFAIDTASHEVGRWVHLVGTYNGSNLFTLYKDGKLVSTGAQVGIGTTSQPFRVGMRASGTTDFFNGYIQDAFVYGATLQADEVLRLYKGWSPLAVRPLALRAYWPLTGGAIEKDLSKTGAHLTMVGSLGTINGVNTGYAPLGFPTTYVAEAVAAGPSTFKPRVIFV